jgi:hypothetical protein
MIPLVPLLCVLLAGATGQVANFVRCEAGSPEFYWSTTGAVWFPSASVGVLTDADPTSGCRDVCFSPDLDLWIATGIQVNDPTKSIASSSTGQSWSLVVGANNILAGQEGRTCGWGGDKFVVAGLGGKFAFSYDGVSWAPGTAASVTAFNGIAYSNQQSIWVAAVLNAGNGGLAVSTNGISNWAIVTTLPQVTPGYMADVVWSVFNNAWVAIGSPGGAGPASIFYSSSSPALIAVVETIPGAAVAQSLVALDSGEMLALIGNTNEIWNSPTGALWGQKSTFPPPSTASHGICALGASVVGVGFTVALTPVVYLAPNAGTVWQVADSSSSAKYDSTIGSVTARTANIFGATYLGNGTFVVPAGTNSVISTPFAFVSGSLTVFGSITFSPSGFVAINKTLDCGPTSTLNVVVTGPGNFTLASFASLSRRFAAVTTTTQSSSNCYTSAPTYSSTTLSVTVTEVSCGFSTGALVGIIVGAVVGGLLITALIVALTCWLQKRYDRNANIGIRMKASEDLKRGF